jgi:hypothetical protein
MCGLCDRERLVVAADRWTTCRKVVSERRSSSDTAGRDWFADLINFFLVDAQCMMPNAKAENAPMCFSSTGGVSTGETARAQTEKPRLFVEIGGAKDEACRALVYL